MRLVLVTPAAWEPLDIEEIKVRPELRITGSTDDATLAAFQRSAIETYQDYTDHILCLSTWDMYLDTWPDVIELPAPLSSVVSIKYQDGNNAQQTLATSVYKVDTTNPVLARVTLKYGQSWPTIYDETNVIVIRFVAGYADTSDIPARIKDGLCLKIQELYDGVNRMGAYHACWDAERRWPT